MKTTVTFQLCRLGENEFFVEGDLLIDGSFHWHLLNELLFEYPQRNHIYALGKDIGVSKSKTIKLKIWTDSHDDGRSDWMDFEEIDVTNG